jgi:F0F1-type ATP synthase delta subunit
MNESDILASRYAVAFVNLYSSKITEKDFFNIIESFNFLSENPQVLLMLEFPFVKENKQLFIDKFLQKFFLISEFSDLLNLLIDSNRVSLFRKILEFITWKYQIYTGKIFFRLYISHQLDQAEIDIIKLFLMKCTNSNIIYNYEVDSALIAGIRALSSNYLWEYSVRSQLQKAKIAFEVTK